jgi:hypothetical protein
MKRRNVIKAVPAVLTALSGGRCFGAAFVADGAGDAPVAERSDGPPRLKRLFIDDEHIERTENLVRRMHQPATLERPVLEATQPHETAHLNLWNAPWWDKADNLWKMIYIGGRDLLPLYATSRDGIEWEKPALNLVSASQGELLPDNLVDLGFRGKEDPNRLVFVRNVAAEPRFSALTRFGGRLQPLVSSDGLTWERRKFDGPPSHDEYRLGYDSLKHRYLATVKQDGSRADYRGEHPVPEYGRAVALSTSEDFKRWTTPELIFHADELDQRQGGERERFAKPIAAAPDASVPVTADGLDLEIRWKDGADLSLLQGREVRIQFLLRNADLYGFWFATPPAHS